MDTPLYTAYHFPFQSPPVSSFYSSIGAWLWSLHIRSGHRLIVHPTGSVGLQQSEGSTLPQTYFSVAQQPECHVRREREREEPLAFGPLSAFSRFLAPWNHFAPLMMSFCKPRSIQDLLDSHREHVCVEVIITWWLKNKSIIFIWSYG